MTIKILTFGVIGLFCLSNLCNADQSISDLEQRVVEIDEQLKKCSFLRLRTGVGAIGCRSKSHRYKNTREWVKVSLDKAYQIDQIVLTPVIGRRFSDPSFAYHSEGFPRKFQIITGREKDSPGEIIAEVNLDQCPDIGISPFILNFERRTVSWIRIVATELSIRLFDGQNILQFSELLAFDGERNVALQQKVTVSSEPKKGVAWEPTFLVDGQLPYLMSNPGESSNAYLGSISSQLSYNIDLGKVCSINEIQLHAVEINDTVPQAHDGGLGIPPGLLIEGAANPNFHQPTRLTNFSYKNHRRQLNVGPIIIHPVSDIECRYVRFRTRRYSQTNRFGFAEIVLISNGKNVALHRPVVATSLLNTQVKSLEGLSVLTDGKNRYGEIVTIRSWLNQLAFRQQLTNEKATTVAQLNSRYRAQKVWLRLMIGLVIFLGISTVFIILVGRILRLRQISLIHERIAADLHDEVGANIHSIGLYGDLAREADSPEELVECLDLCRVYTKRSGDAIRNCSKKIRDGDIFEDLNTEIEQLLNQLLVDLDNEMIFEGDSNTQLFSRRRKQDILLFCKECLINILRHSDASKVTAKVVSSTNDLTIIISDNGIGTPEMPPSLNRRNRLIKGETSINAVDPNGTQIMLYVKTCFCRRMYNKVVSNIK